MRFHMTALPAVLAMALALPGCALDSLAVQDTSAQASARAVHNSDNFYGRDMLPTPAKGSSPTSGGGLNAIKDGLWLAGPNRLTSLRLTSGKIVQTSGPDADVLLSGLGIENRIVEGKAVSITAPAEIRRVDANTVEAIYPQGMRVRVGLQALDISGLKVADLMRDHVNEPHKHARKARGAVFPVGSRAYLPVYSFMSEEILVPASASFIPAKTVPELLAAYTGDAPYCMAGEIRGGNTLLGIKVEPSKGFTTVTTAKPPKQAKPKMVKKVIKDKKGRKKTVMVAEPAKPFAWPATSGPLSIIAVDPAHLLCHRLKGGNTHPGTWKTAMKNGTNVLTIHFSSKVDARDMGIPLFEQRAATLAFVQTDKGMKAGRIYAPNRPVYDYRYRFNDVAAAAISNATGMSK